MKLPARGEHERNKALDLIVGQSHGARLMTDTHDGSVALRSARTPLLTGEWSLLLRSGSLKPGRFAGGPVEAHDMGGNVLALTSRVRARVDLAAVWSEIDEMYLVWGRPGPTELATLQLGSAIVGTALERGIEAKLLTIVGDLALPAWGRCFVESDVVGANLHLASSSPTRTIRESRCRNQGVAVVERSPCWRADEATRELHYGERGYACAVVKGTDLRSSRATEMVVLASHASLDRDDGGPPGIVLMKPSATTVRAPTCPAIFAGRQLLYSRVPDIRATHEVSVYDVRDDRDIESKQVSGELALRYLRPDVRIASMHWIVERGGGHEARVPGEPGEQPRGPLSDLWRETLGFHGFTSMRQFDRGKPCGGGSAGLGRNLCAVVGAGADVVLQG